MQMHRAKTTWGHGEKADVCTPRGEASGWNHTADTLILDFQPVELWEITFCYVSHQSVIFWYDHLNRPTHSLKINLNKLVSRRQKKLLKMKEKIIWKYSVSKFDNLGLMRPLKIRRVDSITPNFFRMVSPAEPLVLWFWGQVSHLRGTFPIAGPCGARGKTNLSY